MCSPTSSLISFLVPHGHLIAVVKSRVLCLLPAPDTAGEVPLGEGVRGAQLGVLYGTPRLTRGDVKAATSALQVEEDWLAGGVGLGGQEVGGGGAIVAEGQGVGGEEVAVEGDRLQEGEQEQQEQRHRLCLTG